MRFIASGKGAEFSQKFADFFCNDPFSNDPISEFLSYCRDSNHQRSLAVTSLPQNIDVGP